MGTMHDWVLVLVSGLFCVGSVAWISASTFSKVTTLKGRILGSVEPWSSCGHIFGRKEAKKAHDAICKDPKD
jgi:hypothetical protein